MSTISGVTSSSSSSDPWAAMKAQHAQRQAKMFAKVDTDSSGGVDKAELTTMLSEISQKTGTSIGSDTEATFTKMDSNAYGNLSSDELGKGMQSLMPPPSTMDFAQSRSANGTSGSGGSQEDLFAKIDTNGDGSVDKAESKVLSDKIKSETGKDTSDMFAKLDTDSDGKLTQTEFDAGKPEGSAQGAKGPGGPGGPPPGGGPGGPGGPGGAGKSESTANKTYDKLDTNQDGTVSELERLVGAIKDAAKASKGDSTGDGTETSEANASDSKETSASFVDVAKLAKQLYSQIAASLSGQSSSTLSATA